jgi:pyruvate dehydrogenase E1 component
MNKRTVPFSNATQKELRMYREIRDHVAKGALSMIDWANHKPENKGKKPKVGGHQASSMSSVDLLCAFYLHCKRPEDRIAVKPHAAPVVYSLMNLIGVLPECDMGRLREFGGPQPYPTKLKNPLFVDYTTSSEALGVCATIYDAYGAIHQNRALHPKLGANLLDATYWALCGDGELTEGQIDESLYDAGRWGLDNLIWIVDLNRQSLDRVMDDFGRLEAWVEAKFRGQGWCVELLRWGQRAESLFKREGGDVIRDVLDGMPDTLFHPLQMLDGGAIRQALTGDVEAPRESMTRLLTGFRERLGMSPLQRRAAAKAMEGLSDEALKDAVNHLGGHDLDGLVRSYRHAAMMRGKPTVVIAHTMKGYETSAAGHPENHGMLLPSTEVELWGIDKGLPSDTPYPRPKEDSPAGSFLASHGKRIFGSMGTVPAEVPMDALEPLASIRLGKRSVTSTGEAFQSLNLALLRSDLAPYMQFCAPDVGQTTHLGPVIKATGVFSPRELPDTFEWLRDTQPCAFDWRPTDTGQFHALGIAEGNAMLWAYAFGRVRLAREGKVPLLSVVTVYDKFFERGFNQLDYATYNNARFVAVGVPSGSGLSRETATHQSLQTLRMMMDLPGVIAYEPAFGADVHAIYLHALGQLWQEDGQAYYLRLTTQPLTQPKQLPDNHAEAALRGGYWLVGEDKRESKVANGANVIFVASGRKLAQVRQAAARLHEEDGYGSRILNVTSYEALWRDWDSYARDSASWSQPERSYYLHELFSDCEVNAPLIMTGDHFPSVAEWLPSALQRMRGHVFLGPRDNGQAGDLESIDRFHGMGVEDLVVAARNEVAWRKQAGIL